MITIIAAIAQNKAIGYGNKLLYWLPNDLKRFKALTTGHTIIMGRKTFDSLPKGAQVTHLNLNDGSIEGIAYPKKQAFSVQNPGVMKCAVK